MSTTTLERQAPPMPSVAPPPASTTSEITHPILWLIVITAIGLALRVWPMTHEAFQQDEFGPVYAVVERASQPGFTPSVQDPLLPVSSWAEVRNRSVLPFGIVNPLPLHNYILYGLVQFLPANEVTFRLPSLLAGVACIVGVYLLCRRLLGAEVALVAAALTAVDPLQIGVSYLARPYALANLACVFSFIALLQMLKGESRGGRLFAVFAYGVSLAFVGYMNSSLLLVIVAHAGLALHHWITEENRPTEGVLRWLAGSALAGLLLLPELSYVLAVGEFNRANREYMLSLQASRLINVLVHNVTVFVALAVATGAGLVIKELLGSGAAEDEDDDKKAKKPVVEPALPPENPTLVWTGRLWYFLPQMAGLLLALAGGQFLFMSRYLSYTTLGAVILLAYWATRDPSRDVRLCVAGVTVLTVFLWGSFMTVGKGFGVGSPPLGELVVKQLDDLEQEGRYKPGDVVLYRAGFLEGDFLPERIAPENRAATAGVQLAPVTTLYVPKTPKAIVMMTYSNHFGETLGTATKKHFDPAEFYTPALAERLKGFERYWICSPTAFERPGYLAGLLPWMANALQWDLKVARKRPDPDRYFDVCTDIEEEDFISGLSDARSTDFTPLVLIRKKQPKGIFALGALSAAAMPGADIAVPLWFATNWRTPRLTQKTDELELGADEFAEPAGKLAENHDTGVARVGSQ